MLKTEISSIVE